MHLEVHANIPTYIVMIVSMIVVARIESLSTPNIRARQSLSGWSAHVDPVFAFSL